MNLPILESFFDKPLIAGYSLASIFQYWWVGLIIIIVAAVALVGVYFLLNWLFGRIAGLNTTAQVWSSLASSLIPRQRWM